MKMMCFQVNPDTGKEEYIYDEDLDDDKESVFNRLPDNMEIFMNCITASQGCLLLLVLKDFLKVGLFRVCVLNKTWRNSAA